MISQSFSWTIVLVFCVKGSYPYPFSSLLFSYSIPAVVGDGIFAKRDIFQGSLVAYYAGSHLYDYNEVMFDNMTVDQREERHKNLVCVRDFLFIYLKCTVSENGK